MLHTRAARILLASILQTAIWLAVLVFDPFGMSTAADRASEDVYLRLFPLFYNDENREKIQIVTVRDGDLPLPMPEGVVASENWPLSHDEYVALFKKVLELKPKAVFVDLFFKPDARRPTADTLTAFFDEPKTSDIPLVFADFGGKKPQTYEAIHGLPFSGGRVLRGLAEFVVRDHHYPIADKDGGLSAAAVLYNATAPRGRQRASSDDPFLVAWGNTVSDSRATEPTCAPITRAWDSRTWALVGALGAGLDTKFKLLSANGAKGWDQLQPCPYHEVTSAKTVLVMPTEMLRKDFQDSYVLIGAEVRGSGDRIVSPVHGEIPGVHLHAMALDNLLTFRGRVPFLPDEWAWPLQGILIFIVAMLGRLFFEGRPEPQSRSQALMGLGVRAGALFVLAVVILAGLLISHFGPNNWGGVMAIGTALFFGSAFGEFFVLVFGPREKEEVDE